MIPKASEVKAAIHQKAVKNLENERHRITRILGDSLANENWMRYETPEVMLTRIHVSYLPLVQDILTPLGYAVEVREFCDEDTEPYPRMFVSIA